MKTTMARTTCYLALLAFVTVATAAECQLCAECPSTADQDGLITAYTNNATLDLTDLIRVDAPLHPDHELAGTCCLAITVLSAGDDSGIDFTVEGKDSTGSPITTTVTGANSATATISTPVSTITRFTRSGPSADAIIVGYDVAACDVAD